MSISSPSSDSHRAWRTRSIPALDGRADYARYSCCDRCSETWGAIRHRVEGQYDVGVNTTQGGGSINMTWGTIRHRVGGQYDVGDNTTQGGGSI